MKRLVLFSVVFVLAFSLMQAQTGKVFDKLSHSSKILKMDRNYAVYLPPDYDSSQRSYPVLYLLHGAGDDQTGWVQFGEVLHITDKAIKESSSVPFSLIICFASDDDCTNHRCRQQ